MNQINNAILQETKRRILEESIPRIQQCLGYLNEDELWYSSNDNCNSVGVLILHLCGNIRQWVLSGACGLQDLRDRDSEFNPSFRYTKSELHKMLDDLKNDLTIHLPAINDMDLLVVKPVQCYRESVLSMLIHAIEHFSYHTGQIVHMTKCMKDIDTAFYSGQDLTAKG